MQKIVNDLYMNYGIPSASEQMVRILNIKSVWLEWRSEQIFVYYREFDKLTLISGYSLLYSPRFETIG